MITEVADLCSCGKPSTIGAHGIRNGEVYDEYLCSKCYSGKDLDEEPDTVEGREQIQDEPQIQKPNPS